MSGHSESSNSGFTGVVYNLGGYTLFSGRTWPESKYFDLYEFGTTYNDNVAYSRAKTGDATTETKGWYGDSVIFAYAEFPWFIRGGCYSSSNGAGVFSINYAYGDAYITVSFRPVLVQK